MAVRLRFRTAPVAPLMGMPDSSSARSERLPSARALRSSCARKPARRFSSALCWRASSESRWKLNSVDGVGDRVVEAAVQRPELRRGERGIALERQVGDGLAQVAVVVDDLVDRVAEREQVLAVRRGGHPHFGQGERIAARRPRDPKALLAFVGLFRAPAFSSAGRGTTGCRWRAAGGWRRVSGAAPPSSLQRAISSSRLFRRKACMVGSAARGFDSLGSRTHAHRSRGWQPCSPAGRGVCAPAHEADQGKCRAFVRWRIRRLRRSIY